MKKISSSTKQNISFKEFCNLKSVKYWRHQLAGANIKNMINKSQLGGTRNAYTYGLLRFHNWLCDRGFQYSSMVQVNKNTIHCHNTTVKLCGVEHLLILSMNVYSKSQFSRLIKSYLAETLSVAGSSVTKNAIYSIRSFFRENESDIVFNFKHRLNRIDRNEQMVSLSLENLQQILTVDNIQPLERAVFLCKFQRGLDSSTLVDRFNFVVWEQLVKHFQSSNPAEWNVKNIPVPIHLARVKTGFVHTGFLDRDAIMTIMKYLNVRHDMPEIGKALFVNTTKKPITVNWISRRFHKLVARSGIQDMLKHKDTNICTPHEMRDLLKSTLLDSGCRSDVADHVIGHIPKDSYEKQAVLYPESLIHEFSKVSERINIFSGQKTKKHSHTRQVQTPDVRLSEYLNNQMTAHERRISRLEQVLSMCL